MRIALGDGYVDTLRFVWDEVPDSADFVMYWWHHAAQLVRNGKLRRFGFISTNSLSQTFNRRVVEAALTDAKKPMALVFAIPDHPWVDAVDGAAVRIAMTVGAAGSGGGRLLHVIDEAGTESEEIAISLGESKGELQADLRIGANVASAHLLLANLELSNIGVIPLGAGFILDAGEAAKLSVGLTKEIAARLIRPYRNGRDLTNKPRGVFAIDTYEYTEEQLRADAPQVWQWLRDRVKPERDQNPRRSRREKWWRYGEDHPRARRAIDGLSRYIATVMTAKHRVFQFVDASLLPDQKLVAIGLDDSYSLGVLSSSIHVTWALASGSRLGVGNDPVYVKSRGFEAFPFPVSTDKVAEVIRTKAQAIDDHRKKQQAAHPGLTLTGMYNVLEKLRSGDALTDKEKTIHNEGLVSVLKQLHDELDNAVLEAYGWADLKPGTADFAETILTRLVALNAQRAAEEATGTIRWLRPEFQNPVTTAATPAPEQATLDVETEDDEQPAAIPVVAKQQAWPTAMAPQFKAVRSILTAGAQTSITLAAQFKGKSRQADIADILDTLESLGQVVHTDDGRYALI